MDFNPQQSSRPQPFNAPPAYFHYLPQRLSSRMANLHHQVRELKWLKKYSLVTYSLSALAGLLAIILVGISEYTTTTSDPSTLLGTASSEEVIKHIETDELLWGDLNSLAASQRSDVYLSDEAVEKLSEQDLARELDDFSNEEIW